MYPKLPASQHPKLTLIFAVSWVRSTLLCGDPAVSPHLPHPTQDGAELLHPAEMGPGALTDVWDERDTSAGVGQRHSTESDPFN